MAYRVIQWGTGNTGLHALRSIFTHPDLELVELKVVSADKVGIDAGTLAETALTGVLATDDFDTILQADADCVLYMARDHTLADPADPAAPSAALVDEICRLLASGKNVIATAVCSLTWPDALDACVIDRIDQACTVGSSAFVATGIDPGFMGDFLPVALTSLCSKVTKVTAQEILSYAGYNAPASLCKYGFGLLPNECNFDAIAAPLRFSFGVAVKAVAAQLGVRLDDVRIRFETEVTPIAFDIPAFRVEPGHVAAVRFAIEGLVDDRPVIILEHVTRINDTIAPAWPLLRGGRYGYRVLIEGTPGLEAEIALDGNSGDSTVDACLATASRAVNMVPLICQAPPGVHSQFTLPLISGRGRVVGAATYTKALRY